MRSKASSQGQQQSRITPSLCNEFTMMGNPGGTSLAHKLIKDQDLAL
jgi:hypothetical protein